MTGALFAEYVRAGWIIVPIEYGLKAPTAKGWNLRENAIDDPDVAEQLIGAGLAHAYSGTCAVDLDDLETARGFLAERGINVDELLARPESVMISSGRENRAKLLYSTPKPLPSFRLPGFELRCAARTGNTVQDALPGTTHPDTGKPYEWKYGCDVSGHWSNLPELPKAIRELWESLITPETKIVGPPREERLVDPNTKRIKEMLNRRDPDCGYDDWIKVGMALHHEFGGAVEGLALWNQWSAKGKKYNGQDDLEKHWRSFRSDMENARTINSLRVDTAAIVDEFPVVTEMEVQQAETEAKAPPKLPATVKEAINNLRRDKSGKVLSILPNILTILGLPSVTGNTLAYDTFQDVLMTAPVGTEEWRAIKDTDYTAIRLWLENTANFYPVSKEMVRDSVHYLAEANKMDTAQKWLSSLEWDGVPRIEKFLPVYMGTIDADYERAVGMYLWTALAGRVMEPGCKVDMVPILVGGQGVGKSSGVQALVPHIDFYTEIRLDEPDDDIARKMRGTLVGELAELRGLRNSDLERIKAFVTRTHEKWTPKYMEFSTTFARRLVMIGTTNEDDFLTDEENRRWLPVRTAGVDVEGIKRDRDQLWAEALQVWMAEGVQWKHAEQLAKGEQEEFKVVDQWDPIVEQWLADNSNVQEVRIHDLLVQAVGMDIRQVTRVHELRVSKILRAHGFQKAVVRIRGKSTKVWRREAVEALDPAS